MEMDFWKGTTRRGHDPFPIQPSSIVYCLNFTSSDRRYRNFILLFLLLYLLPLIITKFGTHSDRAQINLLLLICLLLRVCVAKYLRKT